MFVVIYWSVRERINDIYGPFKSQLEALEWITNQATKLGTSATSYSVREVKGV